MVLSIGRSQNYDPENDQTQDSRQIEPTEHLREELV